MSDKNAQIVLFLSNSDSDNYLLNILGMFNVSYVTITDSIYLESFITEHDVHLILSYKAYKTSCQIIKSINEKLSSIFIYESGNVDIPILSTIDICSNQEHICCEFSGLSFSPSCKHIKCFTEMIEPIDILISTHDRFPIFLRQLQYNCEIFFLSTDIQDINEKLRADFKIKEYFLGIVPLLMYLNHIIPDIFKHVIKRATIIIDDPLLHANYGFLNYNKLISLMEKHTFFTTVAFIPWNYKRSDIQIVNLFLNNKNLIGLCVHGCDHTKCEFSNTNLKHLNKLVKLATARMMEHEKITGLPFDKVMVFPQGKFSNQAIQTLKENNYIAAINTSPTSTNLNELFEVKDFIKPYISKYHGFPLFTRNTPEDIIDISFNLFLGKPVFLVIHHDYLKDNYKKLISAVSYINSRTKYIQWDGVGNIIDAILNTVSIKDVVGLSSINTYDIYGYKEKIYIFFRRKASEFRDNYLSKNKVILEIANSIKKIFKL